MSVLSFLYVLKVLGSISVEEMSEFLNMPIRVSNGSELCTLLNNYNRSDQYLQTVQPSSFHLAVWSIWISCLYYLSIC